MTHQDKVRKVMKEMPNLSPQEAEDKVHFLNWVQQEQGFLKEIYPKFKEDFNTDIPFIGMCEVLWSDATTGLRNKYFALNHIN